MRGYSKNKANALTKNRDSSYDNPWVHVPAIALATLAERLKLDPWLSTTRTTHAAEAKEHSKLHASPLKQQDDCPGGE
jgi:hypothetical protein